MNGNKYAKSMDYAMPAKLSEKEPAPYKANQIEPALEPAETPEPEPAAEDSARTVNHPVDAPQRRGERFRYRPDRHYVLVEAPSQAWDGDVLDRLLDMIDPETHDFAYRIEARGEENGELGEGRRITGHRHKVLLSCSKEFADRVASQNSLLSLTNARSVTRGEISITSMVEGRAVGASLSEGFGPDSVKAR